MLPGKVIENLSAWKRKYDAVLLRKIDGQVLVYRAATPAECESFKETAEKCPQTAEDILLRKCVLFYEGLTLDELPVGIAADIINEAVTNSLYTKNEEFKEELNTARSFAKTLYGNCIALVAKTFGIDPDVLSEFPLKQLIRYTALAEAATGTQISIEEAKKPVEPGARKISELNRELANMGVFDKRGIFNDPEPPDIKIPPEVIERLTKQKK